MESLPGYDAYKLDTPPYCEAADDDDLEPEDDDDDYDPANDDL